MTALTMAQSHEGKPDSDAVECCHCGRVIAFKLRGELTIKCRRCKKLLMIVVNGDGVQKNLLTETPRVASR